ncbi:hypothetical protein [Pseudoalteromonas ruthenica]|uniref:glycine-rich domain-containing protein n=1 Tax=Pseudoalteromonas ruthenica TaxID=151081 RepID=UPI00110A4D05|nr:hypothetical protein [Pseudoalteromonas ruthenica]TMO87695.1 hypothetical protein CWC12_10480 [Pseudoalteromonas ruthenica]TMP21500.1 hypothetical protein CWC06_18305 [Pseudoalteromonas ruthenica]
MDSIIPMSSASLGFPIRAIKNSQMFEISAQFQVPESVKNGVVYITGCGGGGGGAGAYDSGYKAGGQSGHGASSAFRLPIAAEPNDILEVTVAAGGSKASGTSTWSSRYNHKGGDGGSTKVTNLTAISNSRFGPLTPIMTEIELTGGAGGGGDVPVNFGEQYAYPRRTGQLIQQVGVMSTWRDIGFFIEGSQSGESRHNRVTSYSTTNNEVLDTAWQYPTLAIPVLGQEYPQSTVGGTYGVGGPGGSLFSPSGFGTGGRGSSSASNHNAEDGQTGFLLVEWD